MASVARLVVRMSAMGAASSMALGAAAQVPPTESPESVPRAEESALDLTTPRRAVTAFLESARRGEWGSAALVLDLSEISSKERPRIGAEAAQHLEIVLSGTELDPTSLPDEPLPGGEHALELARVPGIEQGVILRRVPTGGEPAWKLSSSTVRAAERMADRIDRGPIGNLTPEWLREPRVLALEPWQWLAILVAVLLSLAGAWIVGRAASALGTWLIRRRHRPQLGRLLERLRLPVRAALFLGFLGVLAIFIRPSQPALEVFTRLYQAAWWLTIGWAFWRGVDFAAERIEERAATQQDWRARGVRTRAVVIRRVLHATGAVIVIAVLLLQFDAVRQLGVSLLASAGVAGIVLGIAAQRTLGNALAGIQLSFTQPLRVGDQILIEGELGTVEEINLSYVVLRLWDHRNLILPIPRLLDTPFENWTRLGTDLIGTVLVRVDFATPIARVRSEVERFVSSHPLFDGATVALQVLEVEERTVTLRVLVSAADASRLFTLRCDVREFIVGLLQRLDGGRYLPRLRLEGGAEVPRERRAHDGRR